MEAVYSGGAEPEHLPGKLSLEALNTRATEGTEGSESEILLPHGLDSYRGQARASLSWRWTLNDDVN